MDNPALHGTCVLLRTEAVFIRGVSGSGKSTLAHILMNHERSQGHFACLVSDDRVYVRSVNGFLIASAPPAIAGLMEVRGRGPVEVPHLNNALVSLVVELLPIALVERMPEEENMTTEIHGTKIPYQAVPVGDLTAAQRLVEAALSFIRLQK
ncbi:HPr kinase/phosphorylase [Flexibacterium corallicola]|uniref:HPr kinase/phosphorylase n=1 Tax=Flexibacterium corallicola TaxID=3037259 RepID=UPI00286FA1C0|nr:HPr kinase/phosphatase C-terminal domain-containing protein [Pseudovibrio sp. M1P-2-3]